MRGKSNVKIPRREVRRRGCFVGVILRHFVRRNSHGIIKEMLCLGLIEEIIDEEEFDPLYAAFRSSNLPVVKEGIETHEV